MQAHPLARHIVSPWPAFTAAALLYGCTTTPDSNPAPRGLKPITVPVANTQNRVIKSDPTATLIDARPAALINGEAVAWGDLRPVLNEIAGAEALQEFILERRVEQALASAGLSVTVDNVVAERKMLLESLSDDPNVAIRMLEELRDRQNLGKVRFEALLRRNAGLRALVQPKVNVSPQAVDLMHQMVHGPTRQARLMIFADLKPAEAAAVRVRGGESFAEVAADVSTDASASRGGLLQPISRVDPAYPEAIRQTLWTLDVGEVSHPILLESGYALLMLVKHADGDGVTLEQARPRLEQLVRMNQERLLMDQLSRTMLSDASVTIFDDALHESWSRRRSAGARSADASGP